MKLVKIDIIIYCYKFKATLHLNWKYAGPYELLNIGKQNIKFYYTVMLKSEIWLV